MNYEKWSENIAYYQLLDNMVLEKADQKQFSVFFALYEVEDIMGLQNWDLKVNVNSSDEFIKEHAFWVKKDGKRIAGVLLGPNIITALFLVPPYNDAYTILAKLKPLLVSWSDMTQKIMAYEIPRRYIEDFNKIGFIRVETRRVMIKPCEKVEVSFGEDFELRRPTKGNVDEIAKLNNNCLINTIEDDNFFTLRGERQSLQYHKSIVESYFEESNGLTMDASSLLYDKKTNELIGSCIVILWNGQPNISGLVVDKRYRRKGLAKNMIHYALSKLSEHYSFIRLSVILGNDAESLYYNHGFLPYPEYSTMYLKMN